MQEVADAVAGEQRCLRALAEEQHACMERLMQALGRCPEVLTAAPAASFPPAELKGALNEPAGMVEKGLVVKQTLQPMLVLQDDPPSPAAKEAVVSPSMRSEPSIVHLASNAHTLQQDMALMNMARGGDRYLNGSDQADRASESHASQDRSYSIPSASPTGRELKTQATVEALLSEHPMTRAEQILVRIKAMLDYIAGFLVLMNSLVLLLQFEMEGRIVGLSVGLTDGEAWDIVPALQIIDIVFVFIFLFEWLVRIAVERWAFLRDYANLFDTVLVMGGLVDMYVNVTLAGDTGASKSIVILRLMRAMKSFRAIRMVRSLRFFRGLRVLVKACQCFLPSLCWSMVLLLIFMAMGALMLGNLLQSFVDDETMNLEDRQWIWLHYGTAYRALYTFYEITFAGNWPTRTRPVMEKVSHGFAVFFVCYITLVVFAIIRVISAVFLKDTLDAAQNDAEALVVDKMQKKKDFVQKLEVIFRAIDDSNTGIISEERLTNILSNPKVAAYFQTMDIDVHEGKALFHVLNNAGLDGVSLDEFIDGILKCKGPARAIDQVAMHAQLNHIDSKLTRLVRNLDDARVITASKSFVDGSNNAKSMAEHLKVFRMDDAADKRRNH